jgi:hypothetical protein
MQVLRQVRWYELNDLLSTSGKFTTHRHLPRKDFRLESSLPDNWVCFIVYLKAIAIIKCNKLHCVHILNLCTAHTQRLVINLDLNTMVLLVPSSL